MKEKQPISKRLKEIRDKTWDYLKGNPEDWPEDFRVEFYGGVPIDEVLKILAGVAGAAGTGFGLFKSLKTIRPYHEGVRLTLKRRSRKPVKEGPTLSDPTGIFQRVPEVDMRFRKFDRPGGIQALGKDGTPINSDLVAMVGTGSSVDIAGIAEIKPVIKIEEDPQINETIGVFTDALSREVIARLTADDLRDETKLRRLRMYSSELLQDFLDTTYLDERGQEEVRQKREQGIPRRKIKRGFIVGQVGFPNLRPSEGIVEAMGEKVEAPMRLDAELTLKRGLGDEYVNVRRTMAIEEIARKGKDVTLVVGLGEGREEAYWGGTLGEVKNLKKEVGDQTIEDIREHIDKLRGEGR